MAKKMRIRKLAVVLLVLSMLTGMLGGFSAFAADKTKEITITTNTDDNPFLRVALYSSVFKTGGPFTVRCEMKIDSYTPNKSDANIFVNIADGRDSAQQNVWLNTWKRKTNGWIEMTDENGAYITFENINKVMISGALEDFALLQFGSYYVDSVIHYRNFRILNAAGSVVYSWDDDSSIEVGEDVRDLETRNLYGETFGDGSADYIISESEAGGDGPAVTDPKLRRRQTTPPRPPPASPTPLARAATPRLLPNPATPRPSIPPPRPPSRRRIPRPPRLILLRTAATFRSAETPLRPLRAPRTKADLASVPSSVSSPEPLWCWPARPSASSTPPKSFPG